jgi:hypothetical protein
MTEMALRSRMAVLVVAALLSIAGAFGTSAFLTTHEAHASTPCTAIYYQGHWYSICH